MCSGRLRMCLGALGVDLVLDFGGGIGTHALANAMSSKVEHVFFVDINQTNR